jgi:hypothetical protein
MTTQGKARDWPISLHVFLCLQLLDVLTTWLGLRMGLIEVNPLVRFLMHMGPVAGVFSAKVAALLIGTFCMWRRLFRVIHLSNYWYAVLVIWNMAAMIMTGLAH